MLKQFFNRDYKARLAALGLAMQYAGIRKPEGSVVAAASDVAAVAEVFYEFLTG